MASTSQRVQIELAFTSQDSLKEISKFKEGLSRGRETAMFFTSALAEFGPAGKVAQQALSGVASALMGGGMVALALEGARIAVGLLKDAWEAEAKAAEEAAKKAQEAADKQSKAALDAMQKVTAGRDAMRRQLFEASGANTLEAELKAQIAQMRFEASGLTGAQRRTAELRIEEAVKAMGEILRLDAEKQAKKLDEMRQKVLEEQPRLVATEMKLAAMPKSWETPLQGAPELATGVDVAATMQEEARRRREEAWAEIIKDRDRRAKLFAEEGKQMAASYTQPLVSAFSDAIAQMIVHAKNFTDIMRDLALQVSRMIVNITLNLASQYFGGGNILGTAAQSYMGSNVRAETAGPLSFGPVPGLATASAAAVAGGGVTINVSTTDPRAVERMLLDNDGAVLRSLRQAARRGRG